MDTKNGITRQDVYRRFRKAQAEFDESNARLDMPHFLKTMAEMESWENVYLAVKAGADPILASLLRQPGTTRDSVRHVRNRWDRLQRKMKGRSIWAQPKNG